MNGKMIDELKPCPFYGGEAVLYADDGVRVLCPKCGAMSKTLIDRMDDGYKHKSAVQGVIDAWNRRVDDGQQ